MSLVCSGELLSRRRQANRKRIVISSDGMTARAPSGRVRLPIAFQVLDDVISSATLVSISELPHDPFSQFQSGIFQRGYNSLKAIKVLVENGHWEGATGLSRQLLELVMNMEYIFVRSENPEEEALRFVRFGMLQQALFLRSRALYEEKIGRGMPELSGLDDASLSVEYGQFKLGMKKDGSIRWASNWCGKSAYKLAQESVISARLDQYELFYRAWSEQLHGAPGALMTSVFPVRGSDWYIHVLIEDDKKIAETIGNSVNLFCELWMILPIMRPSVAGEKFSAWLRQLQETQVGAWMGQPREV